MRFSSELLELCAIANSINISEDLFMYLEINVEGDMVDYSAIVLLLYIVSVFVFHLKTLCDNIIISWTT